MTLAKYEKNKIYGKLSVSGEDWIVSYLSAERIELKQTLIKFTLRDSGAFESQIFRFPEFPLFFIFTTFTLGWQGWFIHKSSCFSSKEKIIYKHIQPVLLCYGEVWKLTDLQGF